MCSQKLFELYEKQYFNEVESKDKNASRLQIPLLLILSISSLFGFFVNGLSFTLNILNILLISLLAISSVVHLFSIFFFVKSFYGYTYELLPSALESEKYRAELIDTYKGYKNGDVLVEKHFRNYLMIYYVECSTHNSGQNDKRSKNIHKTSTFIIGNLLPLAIAFLIFSFGDVKKDSKKEPINVHINKPVKLDFEHRLIKNEEGTITLSNETKPPQPPQPPPKRLIKEDVKLPSKPKPKRD